MGRVEAMSRGMDVAPLESVVIPSLEGQVSPCLLYTSDAADE